MRFGPTPLDEAIGAIAAHTVRAGTVALRKGRLITPEIAAALAEAGLQDIVVARPDAGDVGEDEAASALAEAAAGPGVRVEPPFTGRANLFAVASGLLLADRPTIDAINAVDEAITIATLPAFRPVSAGEMVGTVKIIPYAAPRASLEDALARAGAKRPVAVAPYRLTRVGVVSTTTAALKQSVIAKTVRTLGERLQPAAAVIVAEASCAHEAEPLALELTRQVEAGAELIVVFGASAIADRRDVIPVAIEQAGGRIAHFGMPVDPGNLLLVGELSGRPVIGAPGCARSPKENGFDWVLARLLAGLPVTRAEIAGFGVGGLLVETVSRGQPRAGGEPQDSAPDGVEE